MQETAHIKRGTEGLRKKHVDHAHRKVPGSKLLEGFLEALRHRRNLGQQISHRCWENLDLALRLRFPC